MNQKYSKQEILLKGIFLLRRNGYHNTGIKEILTECGIPKGSFYNFFKSKEDFGLQALDLYGKSMLKLIQKFTRDETLSPFERIQQYFEMTIEANAEEEARHGCLSMNFSAELSGYNDAFAEKNRVIFALWIQELGACIQEGQAMDEFRRDYNGLQLAHFLYTAFFGAFVRAKTERNPQPLEIILETSLDFITPWP